MKGETVTVSSFSVVSNVPHQRSCLERGIVSVSKLRSLEKKKCWQNFTTGGNLITKITVPVSMAASSGRDSLCTHSITLNHAQSHRKTLSPVLNCLSRIFKLSQFQKIQLNLCVPRQISQKTQDSPVSQRHGLIESASISLARLKDPASATLKNLPDRFKLFTLEDCAVHRATGQPHVRSCSKSPGLD